MLPSLDNVLSMWFTAVPVFEWEPEAPPAEAAAPALACDATVAPIGDADEQHQGMRRVFKGYEWIPTAVWTQRESPAWELLASNQREEDDERAALKNKPAQRPAVPAAHDETPAADAPDLAVGTDHIDDGAWPTGPDAAGDDAHWEHS